MNEKDAKAFGIGIIGILVYLIYTFFGIAASLAIPVAIIGYFVHDYYTFQKFLSDWIGSSAVASVIMIIFMAYAALKNK